MADLSTDICSLSRNFPGKSCFSVMHVLQTVHLNEVSLMCLQFELRAIGQASKRFFLRPSIRSANCASLPPGRLERIVNSSSLEAASLPRFQTLARSSLVCRSPASSVRNLRRARESRPSGDLTSSQLRTAQTMAETNSRKRL